MPIAIKLPNNIEQDYLDQSTPYIQWLILKILLDCGGHKSFLEKSYFMDDEIADFIGLDVEALSRDFDRLRIRQKLQKRYRQLQGSANRLAQLPALEKNLATLQEILQLSDAECQVLLLTMCFELWEQLSNSVRLLPESSKKRGMRVVAHLLDIEPREAALALSKKGKLSRTGLLRRIDFGHGSLSFDYVSDDFIQLMLQEHLNPIELFSNYFKRAPAGHLQETDYAHIDDEYQLLKAHLHSAIAQQKQGVNYLIYGEPGTGKTELTRLIAEQLDCELFEVASEEDDGDIIARSRRLEAYNTAQKVLSDKKALLCFDEIEDVFKGRQDFLIHLLGESNVPKAWLNNMLETNSSPTFWLANAIKGMDSAYIRRFDMVIELKQPEADNIIEQLEQAMPTLLDKTAIKRIAEHKHITPAVIERASSVVKLAAENCKTIDRETAFVKVINNTLKAQGHKQIAKVTSNELPDYYRAEFINADMDLNNLLAHLPDNPQARLCLYGPPGTGKSAYSKWLLQQCNQPYDYYRVSDILGAYVGETEKRIAKMFSQAEDKGHALIFDEVDSLLQDRTNASRSWETTQVNEMLTQMESFSGIFIASTNLVDTLDAASLRRFDAKIKFDYLSSEQLDAMFEVFCQHRGLSLDKSEVEKGLQQLAAITPGDFALIARQSGFNPLKDSQDLLQRLQNETALKNTKRARIGFM